MQTITCDKCGSPVSTDLAATNIFGFVFNLLGGKQPSPGMTNKVQVGNEMFDVCTGCKRDLLDYIKRKVQKCPKV
jgi:hypothetical protein